MRHGEAALTIALSDGAVARLAARLLASEEFLKALADRVAERMPAPSSSPYLTVAEAADYLRASRQRVYDLLSAGRLTRHKDGSRVLVSRAELDAYLAGAELPHRCPPPRNPSSHKRSRTRR